MLDQVRRIAEAIRFRWKVRSLPDRRYMKEVMLPAIRGAKCDNILLVGTRRYTVDYPKRLQNDGTTVWTIDYDREAERWGNGSFHRTTDVREVDQVLAAGCFDVVLANGILGFGIDQPADVKAMTDAVARLLKPGGFLMLGWDADRAPDPTLNHDIRAKFQHAGLGTLPARHAVTGYAGFDHVFDWFQTSASLS